MTGSSRFLLLALGLLATACGGSNDGNGGAGGSGGGGGGGGNGGIDDTVYVPAPRGTERPLELPASAVDCASGEATLDGRFVAPNGSTPVAGAFVYVASGDCWAGTDDEGRFSAKGVPAAETIVRAEKGLFRADADATPGRALSMQVDPAEVRMAYVAGSFDTVQFLLEELGFTPDRIDEDSLATAPLADYHALFLNCGLAETQAEDPAVQEALREYVENGGALYASDWAQIYVEAVFPGKVDFLQPDPRSGGLGEQQATVHDEGLKRALGKSTAEIHFDAPIWVVIDAAPAGTEVLVSGPVQLVDGASLSDRPYTVQFPAGEGRVTYTSFHLEAMPTDDMVTILEQLVFAL